MDYDEVRETGGRFVLRAVGEDEESETTGRKLFFSFIIVFFFLNSITVHLSNIKI